MNAERILQHFERISEAPDAVPRLRQFIFDLAVRGKLVEQDPDDEPASELLKRIEAKKAQLVKGGKIRKQNSLPPVDQHSIPFHVPSHWAWLQLSELGLLSGGMTPSKNRPDFWDGDINWFSPKDIKSDELIESELKITSAGVAETGLLLYRPGCLFIVARSGILKRTFPVAINRVEATANQDLKVLTPFIEGLERYLQIMFRGMTEYILSALVKTGTTVQSLKYDEFEVQPLPLPPLAEQHRIVAKVDELMALCDQLEAAKTEREQSRDRLVAASLHRLSPPAYAEEANAPEAFRDYACFIFNHFPRLTTRPEHIKQLRQTILNLAVRGKLVPQDPNDEPASGLPHEINRNEEDFAPFILPDSWTWAKVEEIANTRLGKMLDKAKNKGTERRYLRNVNVRWFDFDLSDVLTMRFEDSELEEFSLRIGDVLICEGGEPGRSAVWDGREQNIYFQKAIHRVRFSQRINPHYFVDVLKESADSGRLAGYFTGVGIKHFTGKGLSSFLVPLPPVAEQHRIVAKVDELMALCDQLEAQLTTTEADSRRLLEAVLHEALAPALEETA